MERVFVALDVETTGLEPGVDEIIEIGAVKFRGEEVLETFSRLVKPRHSLPLKIARLTGITEAELAAAPRFSAVAPELAQFLKSYPIVGHSISFDLRMLEAQGIRLPQPRYDTFELATLLLPRAPAYRLGSLAAALGIAHDDAHRAYADADVARQVFLHLLARIDALDLAVLSEINRLTARLASWPVRDLFTEAERAKARLVFVEDGGRKTETPLSVARPPSARKAIPLQPADHPRPIDLDAVRAFFAPEGTMGRAFPGYEQRPQQVAMAEAVATALNRSSRLVVEAGTGVGKSMAYLMPAALHACQRGERVVVSTNTINLQDQLFFKDIPDLQRLLEGDDSPPIDDQRQTAGGRQRSEPRTQNAAHPFTAALLKGRGNYLCLRRYKELRRDGRLTADEIRTLLKIQLWLPTTDTGDKAELLLMEGESAAWGRVNVTPETCIGPRCADFHDCYYFKARRDAEAAHILVVNHALLLADLGVEAGVLPPYDHLIIDEAHNLEDVATDQLGFVLDQARMLQFLDDLFLEGGVNVAGGLLAELPRYFQGSTASQADADRASALAREIGPVVGRAREAVYAFFDRLTQFMTAEAEVSAYDPRLRLTPAVRRNPAWGEIEMLWQNVQLQLVAIGAALGRLEALLGDLKDADLLEYDTLLLRVQSLRRFATDTQVAAGHVIFGDSEELITWLNFDRKRDALELHAAPLSVAELLRANLFDQKATTVLASATLTVDGDFEFVKSRIGLEAPDELQLDSPFDYRQQALVYVPNDLPEPNQNGYQRALERAIIELCTASEGRALVLFTANNALRQTYRAIQEPLEEAGIAVLGQGIDGSRRSLLERFRDFPRTVLLGTSSFWEGVDVVGDTLSVLVIAKLPFSVPNDPVFAARCERYGDAFHEFAVPQAILRFKQGFGRLIRSRSDRGIVAVLDRRLLSKKYGQVFLDSLPHTNVCSGPVKQLPELAARFLAAGATGRVPRAADPAL
jgi:DNA polymerase-3 subunit epsilon/ATP-dependent DNA helicase DinG